VGKKETSLIDEFSYPKLGSGQFWEILAAEVERKGGEIRRKARVVKVVTEGERVTAVELADGERSLATRFSPRCRSMNWFTRFPTRRRRFRLWPGIFRFATS
jgi:phytoene dehydrogenase-like protein